MERSLIYRSSVIALAIGLCSILRLESVSVAQTPLSKNATGLTSLTELSTSPSLGDDSLATNEPLPQSDGLAQKSPMGGGDGPDGATKIQPSIQTTQNPKPPDFNRDIFHANKLEFSQELGFLPINIPCPFDFLTGDPYIEYPLKYTLVPLLSTLRWQIDDLDGPWFLRGNWELDISGAVVAIPRGAETRYFAWIMGMRRNFVPHNWRATPYWDWRLGLGNIDAKGRLGVPYAQGQDFTFTINMGSGVRYNFSPRYAISAGLNWMHISNANLSQGKPPNWGIRNYGINVYGPMIGIDFQLRRHPRPSE